MTSFRNPIPKIAIVIFCWSAIALQTPAQRAGTSTFDQIAKQAAEASASNRIDEAAQLYRKALTIRPGWAEGWWSLGTLEYERDGYVEAAKAFRRLLVLTPKNGTAHVMLGLSEFELGQDAQALKHIQEGDELGVTKDPQLRRVALYHQGVLLLRTGQFLKASGPLKSLCEGGLQSAELAQSLGQAVFGMTPKEAPGQGTPGFVIVNRAGQAECLAAQNNPQEAREIYKSLLAEYPEYPNLHYVYGRFLLDLHETDAAIVEFKTELGKNPKHVNSLLQIAAVRYRTDSEDGVQYAEKAVALAPNHSFAHYLYGLLLADTGKAAEAIPHLEIARRAFPKEPTVYFALGSAYAKVGRKADAARVRAIFVQLNSQKKQPTAQTVYGEQSPPLSEDKMNTGPQEKTTP